jgi:hypothetical protein
VATNPNWPLLRADWAPSGHIGYGSSWSSYEDMPWVDGTVRRLIRQWSTKRGRAYETNQVQSGNWVGTWDNTDGALDPANTSSPFYPLVIPYAPLRLRAQWPPNGVNLLTVDQATSGEGGLYGPGASPSLFGIDSSPTSQTEYQVVASASAYQGTQVCEFTGAAASGGRMFYTRVPLAPASPYSYTAHARCMTSGQNPLAHAFIAWYGATGTQISVTAGSSSTLTGSPSATWTTLTASAATPPAGAYTAMIGVIYDNGLTTGTTVQDDGLQWEANASPSAFAVPNPWYGIFCGGVERYPQSWTSTGTFGQSVPTAVDAFALLSQSVLPDPLTAAIFTPAGGSAPSFAYLLADSSGSTTFADRTGNQGPAQVQASKFGGGTIAPGTQQTAATPAGKFLGSAQTVTNLSSSTTAGTNTYGQPMSWISLPKGPSGVYGPGGGTGRNFTRMIAFRVTQTPTNNAQLWIAQDTTFTDRLQILVTNTYGITFGIIGPGGTPGLFALGAADLGNWHLAFLGISSDGLTVRMQVDTTNFTWNPGSAYSPTLGFAADSIGAELSGTGWDPLAADNNFTGDLAMAVEWPFLLSNAQMSAIYTAWRTAFSGDSAGQRYSRILGWAGWTGPTVIDNGSSTSLGPATNLAGQDALSALQAVVDTEAGNHFVDGFGRVVFKSRADRYNKTIAAYTFGENVAGGEVPYEDLGYDLDPTLVCNIAQVTQQTTGQVFTAQDATSQQNNGTRTRTITNLSNSANECQDQATYVVSRYKTPMQRIRTLRLHPSAIPTTWPTVLSLELGTRLRINRRPPSGNQITTDGFVESIAISAKPGDAFIDLQISPADLTPYGVFAALHVTLKNQAASGQATAVLNPLSDSATNSFSAYVFSGMQMTLEPGTANAETLTVLSVSATAPGYTSVTVTFTANLAKTHAVGTVICEALPALSQTTYAISGSSYTPPGTTDPTKWDTSTFGNVKFAY